MFKDDVGEFDGGVLGGGEFDGGVGGETELIGADLAVSLKTPLFIVSFVLLDNVW